MRAAVKLCVADCRARIPHPHTTADRMVAHLKLDRRRVCLCEGELRMRASLADANGEFD